MRQSPVLSDAQRRKQTILGVAFIVAVVLDLVATFQISSGHASRGVAMMFGIAAGIMIGTVIVFFKLRRTK
jgi:predicted phage tail protein